MGAFGYLAFFYFKHDGLVLTNLPVYDVFKVILRLDKGYSPVHLDLPYDRTSWSYIRDHLNGFYKFFIYQFQTPHLIHWLESKSLYHILLAPILTSITAVILSALPLLKNKDFRPFAFYFATICSYTFLWEAGEPQKIDHFWLALLLLSIFVFESGISSLRRAVILFGLGVSLALGLWEATFTSFSSLGSPRMASYLNWQKNFSADSKKYGAVLLPGDFVEMSYYFRTRHPAFLETTFFIKDGNLLNPNEPQEGITFPTFGREFEFEISKEKLKEKLSGRKPLYIHPNLQKSAKEFLEIP